MDYSWMIDFPQKKSLLESVNISSLFFESKLPYFTLDPINSKKWLALYWFDEHKVTIQKQLLKNHDEDECINVILHELGHSTTKYTNRWNRLIANSGLQMNQVKMLEEQIAEILALIFRFTLFGTAKGTNIKQFKEYMFKFKSKYAIPWEEVDNAIRSLVVGCQQENALVWSDVVRKYIVRHSIADVKGGIFNG